MRIRCLSIALCLVFAACGNNTQHASDLGVADNGVPDLGAPDTGAGDGGGCVGAADGTACESGGLCKGQTCTGCTPVTDDSACNTAYGSSGNPYLCAGGTCVPGDCHQDSDCGAGRLCGVLTPNHCDNGCKTSADCPTGQVCGSQTPGQCGGCVNDAQCAALGTGFICDTNGDGGMSGTCVSATCSPTGPCAASASDFCCGGSCVAGDCCSGDATYGDTYCRTKLGTSLAHCTSDFCTACPPVTGNTYLVDPVMGSDLSGNGGTGVCAFKTIFQASRAIGQPTAATIIELVSDDPATSERFPIEVPQNTTVEGMTATTTVHQINSPGFLLDRPNSALTSLIIDGGGQGDVAVDARPFTGTGTLTISAITIQNMNRQGIRIDQGGNLTIGAGVVSQHNDITRPTDILGTGLDVRGTATINQTDTTKAPIQFVQNPVGILVEETGVLDLTGSSSGNGTVIASNNLLDGVYFTHVNGTGASTITGLVAENNSGTENNKLGSGLQIETGFRVRVRQSRFLGNGYVGIRVSPGSTISASGIDLGVPSDFGHNLVQDALKPNLAAGICLEIPSSIVPLEAEGNVFTGGHDCSLPGQAKIVPVVASLCNGSRDDVVENSGTSVDIALCPTM